VSQILGLEVGDAVGERRGELHRSSDLPLGSFGHVTLPSGTCDTSLPTDRVAMVDAWSERSTESLAWSKLQNRA
jgi:hypothetical protein